MLRLAPPPAKAACPVHHPRHQCRRHGWFVDATPGDNSEFLPTSNPNEWVAKAGSEAAGKMDMLIVLLHEYGHTLGLDHSADTHDFMATTLQPGVRRTLTVDQQC